ncbi:hypothetical protein DRW03_30535, partial [Corallococcus sp. H22C18031201]
MMSAPVDIVAVAARPPVEFSAESSAAAVRAGISRYAEYLGGRLDVLLSLPETRPGFSEADAVWLAASVAARIQRKAPHARVESTGRGNAGVIRAIERVLRVLAERGDGLVSAREHPGDSCVRARVCARAACAGDG